MPWLFVVSLLAAGIIFLVTGLRSDRAGEFNINLLAAGVDFAATSLVTAFVVDRFRSFREARHQARLYEVVTDRLTTAAKEWAATLPRAAERQRPRATAGDAAATEAELDLTGTLQLAATALETAGFNGLAPDDRAAVTNHSTRLLQRFTDSLELLYVAAPSPALLGAVDDLRLAQHRWSAHHDQRETADDLVINTQATLQAALAAETALGDQPPTTGIFQRARRPVQLAVGMLLLPLPAAVGGVIWVFQAALGRVPGLRLGVDAVPSLVSLVLGVFAVTSLRGGGPWLGAATLAVGCAAAAEPFTLLASIRAATAKATPDVLAGIVILVATLAVVAGWQAAAALTAAAVLTFTTLLVAWIRFQDRFEHWVRSRVGVGVAPRRLTGAGWLAAIVGWVGATALLVLAAGRLGGAAGQAKTTGLWVVVVASWCGYWVSLPLRDWLTRHPGLSRPIPHS